jgi:hypothetical protein
MIFWHRDADQFWFNSYSMKYSRKFGEISLNLPDSFAKNECSSWIGRRGDQNFGNLRFITTLLVHTSMNLVKIRPGVFRVSRQFT